MSNPQVLLEKRQRLRDSWVEFGDGKALKVRRPLLSAALALQRKLAVDAVVECAIDWRGFHVSDVLTSGGADEVPFDAALLRDVIADRPDWIVKADKHIADAINAYAEQLQASLGNSPST